jgi:hypothetical protein
MECILEYKLQMILYEKIKIFFIYLSRLHFIETLKLTRRKILFAQ